MNDDPTARVRSLRSRGREGTQWLSAPPSFERSEPLRRSSSTRCLARCLNQVPSDLPSIDAASWNAAFSDGARRRHVAGWLLMAERSFMRYAPLDINGAYSIISSMIQRSYQFRFYPNAVQTVLLAQFFGASRWVWNTALAWRSHCYKIAGEKVTGVDFSRELTWLKKLEPLAWLASVPATVLVQTLRDQDRAFANFFGKRARYPRFKRRSQGASIRFQLDQRVVMNAYRAGEFLKLTGLGLLDVRWSRVPGGVPKMVTVRRDACGRYFVSFMVEEHVDPLPASTKSVGVDLGVNDVVVTSDGRKTGNPKHLNRYKRRLKLAQRRLSRKRKGSNRWRKQSKRVARIYARVAATRADFQHKLTTGLIRENGVIALENLNVRGMTASAKGTIEVPGKKVAQKAGLNRSILDAGFGEIRRQIEYKAKFYGRTIVLANRFAPTSKTCSECGAYQADMSLAVRMWTCPDCGAVNDRDSNAARNILAFAAGGWPVDVHGGRTNPSAVTDNGCGMLAPVEMRTNPECAGACHG